MYINSIKTLKYILSIVNKTNLNGYKLTKIGFR